MFASIQSINQSKHICIAPYVANESEAHMWQYDYFYWTDGASKPGTDSV